MADTTFVAGTVVAKEWLNDVNDFVYNNAINIKMAPYNAVGDGTTNDAAAFQAALIALSSGGRLYIPSGTYLISTSVTIPSNILIVGDGATTIIKGGISSFLTATSSVNIEFRDLKFLNTNYRVFFDTCTNIRLIDCYGDGTRDTTNVTNQGFWFRACDEVLIQNPTFVNYRDAIYCDANGATPCGSVMVRGGTIEQTLHGASIDYPTGVYGVDVQKLFVESVVFKNIKASSDSTALGTGYGVYEGDGTDGNLDIVKVTDCKFIDDDGYTTRPMVGILISVAKVGMVDSCYFKGPSGGSFVGFIYAAREQTIQNSIFDSAACQLDRLVGTPKTWIVANNLFKNITGRVLRVSPNAPAVDSLIVMGNTFRDCTYGPITLVSVTYAQIIGNTIYECNTSGQVSDSYRAGINFDGTTAGLVASNTIINISTGLCQYGISIANPTNTVVVSPNNYFKGMTTLQTRNTLAAAPTTGTWGQGDSVWNWAPSAAGTPGWVCTTAGTPGTWKAQAVLAA